MNYSTIDYVNAAIEYIKDWLKKNNIKLTKKTPLSYIEAKYGEKIREELGLYKSSSIERLGLHLMDNGLVYQPSLRPKTKFLTKNKNLLNRVVDKTKPKFSNITFTELKPYEVVVELKYDGDKILREGTFEDYNNITNWFRHFKSFLEKYAGLTTHGNPDFGDVRINYAGPFAENLKNEIPIAEIKKFLKGLPENKHLRQIKVDDYFPRTKFKLIYTGGWSNRPRYDVKASMEKKFTEYIQSLGFHPDWFELEY